MQEITIKNVRIAQSKPVVLLLAIKYAQKQVVQNLVQVILQQLQKARTLHVHRLHAI